MKNNQNGFSVILVILILGILANIAFVGWRITSRKTSEVNNQPATQSQATNVDSKKVLPLPADWKWYESEDKSVKFGYPSTWGTLTEQTQKESQQSYNTNNFIQPLVITNKKDLLVQIPKGSIDYKWYFWDKSDIDGGLVSALDASPPEDKQLAAYDKPNKLGRTDRSPDNNFLVFKHKTKDFEVHKVAGKGATNCGTQPYFFEINSKIVHIQAALCERSGELQPDAGQAYTDVVEGPMKDIPLYIN